MSVKLNRPPKPEECQKNSNFNGKTIPYPGFEPGTSGLAVGSHTHCTIGSVFKKSREQITDVSKEILEALKVKFVERHNKNSVSYEISSKSLVRIITIKLVILQSPRKL
jgi:hypothetical protein